MTTHNSSDARGSADTAAAADQPVLTRKEQRILRQAAKSLEEGVKELRSRKAAKAYQEAYQEVEKGHTPISEGVQGRDAHVFGKTGP